MPTDFARKPVALLEHPEGFYLYVSRKFTLEASPPFVDLKVFAGKAGREKEILNPLHIIDIQEYIDSFFIQTSKGGFFLPKPENKQARPTLEDTRLRILDHRNFLITELGEQVTIK
jgi:hypothetical protein